jgi:hypothetical protein
MNEDAIKQQTSHDLHVFSTHLRKNTQIPNFIKIRPVEAELSHADMPDGKADMTKLIVIFSNFAITPRQAELIWKSHKIYFLPHRQYVHTVTVKIL